MWKGDLRSGTLRGRFLFAVQSEQTVVMLRSRVPPAVVHRCGGAGVVLRSARPLVTCTGVNDVISIKNSRSRRAFPLGVASEHLPLRKLSENAREEVRL